MSLAKKTYSTTFFALIFIGTFLQADTSAYLDPGSGSMIIQGLIAALAAVGYTLRLYWDRIRQSLGRSKSRAPVPEEERTF